MLSLILRPWDLDREAPVCPTLNIFNLSEMHNLMSLFSFAFIRYNHSSVTMYCLLQIDYVETFWFLEDSCGIKKVAY